MNQLGKNSIGLFFLLMLIFPTVLRAERGLFLAFILLGTIIALIHKPDRWCVSNKIFYWLIVCITYSVLSIFWGVLHDAPGAISVSTVYVIWPILYVYMIGHATKFELFVFLSKILMVGFFVASASGMLLVISSLLPQLQVLNPYFNLLDGNVGLYDGTVKFTLNNMPTAFYGLAFSISFLLLGDKVNLHFHRKWIYFSYINLILSILVMLISGRKAFIVVGLVAAPLSLAAMRFAGIRIMGLAKIIKSFFLGLIISLVAIFTAAAVFGIDLESVFSDFAAGFDFHDQANISASRRGEQFDALLREWQSSPVLGLGHGNGAVSAPGDVDPWAYELQYIALLFQTGLLGILVYASAVFWLLIQLIKNSYIDSKLSILMIPLFVALSCFLVANATNPYLTKFDYLWVIFLPLGLVNLALIRTRKGIGS